MMKKKRKKTMKNEERNDQYKPLKILILQAILRFLAIGILKKYQPRVVAITGSVGKTSSKEAISAVLSVHYRVRKNEKNYNNEIGLPLTIIGAEGGGNSFLKWAGVFLRAVGNIIFPVKYPEVLILEMGADRPGDIGYLASFIKSEVAVITDVSGSHLEFFKTIERVGEEKWTLVNSLNSGSYAAINIDNAKISKLKSRTKKEGLEFLTFGFSEEADVQAKEVFYNYSEDDGSRKIRGISFKLNYKGTTLPVRLNNILAEHNIYAALSGVAVGIAFKLNLVEIATSLENFSMPLGRMTLIPGIKKSFIIDDSYNSSPVSALAALEVVRKIEARRKIVVMGDMLELGKDNEAGHRNVARKFLEIKNGIFFAVGTRMQFAVEELKKHNISPKRIFVFSNPMSAGKKLQEIMEEGDLVLVKGSQGMRMEKVVEEVMAEPQKAQELLCRQNEQWKKVEWKAV
jgi:UDP-N-acetylmuramoyl-tripeptide--D-alanyl-D-alanine ligase